MFEIILFVVLLPLALGFIISRPFDRVEEAKTRAIRDFSLINSFM